MVFFLSLVDPARFLTPAPTLPAPTMIFFGKISVQFSEHDLQLWGYWSTLHDEMIEFAKIGCGGKFVLIFLNFCVADPKFCRVLPLGIKSC